MVGLSAMTAGVLGLATGACVGFAVRRARLCTLGAIESALVGGDWRRMKVFGLALAIALIGTQALIVAGLLDESQTTLLPPRVAWLSVSLGSVLFGLGMALVGTCAFGSLVRLGGGDLRSLVTLLIFGAVGYMTLRGALAGLRIDWLEPVSFETPGGGPSSLHQLAGGLLAFDTRLMLVALIAGALLVAVGRDRRLRHSPRLIAAGMVLGLGVVTGWVVTGVLVDAFSHPRPQSLTFVAPVARGLYASLLGSADWLDFSVMTAPGVILGAYAAARSGAEFRWEAFDDHHEMRRHLVGAVLMGFGGVLAGGCTIGQGVTAGSLLAVSWPIAVTGMMLGARLGLVFLVEGSVRDIVANRFRRWSGAQDAPAE
ncbi:MAG: YeeE/YedE family protein [Beijerinckiaceae bacterium]|nr:YeeE/YedE family protein [Beijerinckiaceae bacterium]